MLKRTYSAYSTKRLDTADTITKPKSLTFYVPPIDQYSYLFRTQTSETERTMPARLNLRPTTREINSRVIMSAQQRAKTSESRYRTRANPQSNREEPLFRTKTPTTERSRQNSPQKELNPVLKAELKNRLDEMLKQRELSGEKSILRRKKLQRSNSALSTYRTSTEEGFDPQSRRSLTREKVSSANRNLTSSSPHRGSATTQDPSLLQADVADIRPSTDRILDSQRDSIFGSKGDDKSILNAHGVDLELIALTGINIKAVLSTAQLWKVAGKEDSSTQRVLARKSPLDARVAVKDCAYIPESFKKRGQFVKQMEKTRDFELHKVPTILSKPPKEREKKENLLIAHFLKEVDLLNGFDLDVLWALGLTMSSRNYEYKQYLCHEGDYADGVWIVLEGTIIVEKDGVLKGEFTVNDVVGRQAIENQTVRAADLMISSPGGACLAFIPNREFYDLFSKKGGNREADARELFDFLQTIPFFKNFTDLKIYKLATALKYKKYYRNEVIYKKGAAAKDLYLMTKGKIHRETSLSTETVNNWPATKNMWEWGYRKRLRTFEVAMEILPGELIGFKEMLYCTPREENVLVDGDSEVYFIDRDKFLSSKVLYNWNE